MSFMKQTLRPSRSASGSIDYPGPRVYGQLSPDDKDDPEPCPVCFGTGEVTSHLDGLTYSCPECSPQP
jgi:hypothetical protein